MHERTVDDVGIETFVVGRQEVGRELPRRMKSRSCRVACTAGIPPRDIAYRGGFVPPSEGAGHLVLIEHLALRFLLPSMPGSVGDAATEIARRLTRLSPEVENPLNRDDGGAG